MMETPILTQIEKSASLKLDFGYLTSYYEWNKFFKYTDPKFNLRRYAPTLFE